MHKKNTKVAETSEDVLHKQTELEKEVVSLREQVMNLQQKPSKVPVSLPDKPDVDPDLKCQPSTNTSEEEHDHEEELIVTLPLENRFSILQEPGPQNKQNSLNSLPMDNKPLLPTNTNSVEIHQITVSTAACSTRKASELQSCVAEWIFWKPSDFLQEISSVTISILGYPPPAPKPAKRNRRRKSATSESR